METKIRKCERVALDLTPELHQPHIFTLMRINSIPWTGDLLANIITYLGALSGLKD